MPRTRAAASGRSRLQQLPRHLETNLLRRNARRYACAPSPFPQICVDLLFSEQIAHKKVCCFWNEAIQFFFGLSLEGKIQRLADRNPAARVSALPVLPLKMTLRPHNDDSVHASYLFDLKWSKAIPKRAPSAAESTLGSHRKSVSVCPAWSGEYAVRRVRIKWGQANIESESCSAIGTDDRVHFTHVEVDVRMIVRWRYSNAFKFSDANANLIYTVVVSELGIAVIRLRG